VKLSLGAVVAADVRLTEGEILLDQSCSPVNQSPSKPELACKHMQARWFAGAKPLRKLRRREHKPSLDVRRNWFARHTSKVLSRRLFCAWSVNLAMFNGVIIVMLVGYAHFLKMPAAEIIPLVLTAILASIPWRSPPHSLLRPPSVPRPWQSWAFCRPDFRRG